MTVIFEFEQSGKLYRIIRKRSTVGRGKNIVELYEHNGGVPPLDWSPLATSEAAKNRILDILARDFDTFTTSSFLLQGQGEKIITLKPTERYRVVFDLMGLDRYAELKSKATKRKNLAIGQKDTLLRLIEDLQAKAAQLEQWAQSKVVYEKDLATYKAKLKEREAALTASTAELAVLDSKQKEVEGIKKELAELEAKKAKLTLDMYELSKQVKFAPADIASQVAEMVGQVSLEQAMAKSAEISARISSMQSLTEEIAALDTRKKALADRKKEIEEHKDLQKKILDNKDKILSYVQMEKDLTAELVKLKGEQEGLEKEVETLNAQFREASELANRIHALQTEVDIKKKECEGDLKIAQNSFDAADREAGLLTQTTCKGEGEFASCPLIAKAVGSKNQLPALKSEVDRLSKPLDLPAMKELAEFLEKQKASDKASIEQALSGKNEALSKVRASIKEKETRLSSPAFKSWTGQAPKIESSETEIKRGEAMAADLDKDIAEVEAKAKTLQAQVDAKPALQKDLDILECVVSRLRTDSESRSLQVQIEPIEKAIGEVNKKLEALISVEASLSTLKNHIEVLKNSIEGIKEEEKHLFSEISRIEAEIKACVQADEDAKTKEAEVQSLSVKISLFEMLEDAYEKIPFLILDNIVGIMEEQANLVLEEISTTGMRVELRTEKLNKNGKGAKDALDIIVSDIAGERRIEAYSGGEKTRQILALAVGLAELSARKAGVKVETLLIDEPSGLDAQGLADFGRCFIRLVDSGMFKKGLLVAHDELLKDIFEQKILVSKNGSGSKVEVIV